MGQDIACEICGSASELYDSVDFNKSCTSSWNSSVPLTGELIPYYLCLGCGFCFAAGMRGWSLQEFSDKVYNADYILVDPEHTEKRPLNLAGSLMNLLGGCQGSVRHLDYGGGSGILSETMRLSGYDSFSHDIFYDSGVSLSDLGKFNLVTAFEVFEHVPDSVSLLEDLNSVLDIDSGIIIFTTLLSDGHIRRGGDLSWWYAGPRNGHISLFSRKSLEVLGGRFGFKFMTNGGINIFVKNAPDFAVNLLGGNAA